MLLQLQIREVKVEITTAANVCFITANLRYLGKGLFLKDSGEQDV
jgi:hypothetical protein